MGTGLWLLSRVAISGLIGRSSSFLSMSTQECGARIVAGCAGRDACDVAMILRGGEQEPKRDSPESNDGGFSATASAEVSLRRTRGKEVGQNC